MFAPGTWKGVFWIVALGIGLGVGYNLVQSKPLPWMGEERKVVSEEDLLAESPQEPSPSPSPGGGETPSSPGLGESTPEVRGADDPPGALSSPPPPDPFADVPRSEFPIEIGLARAKELYDRGGLVVLDSREHEEYAENHIRDALSASYDEVAGDVDWLDAMADRPAPILVYCGGGDCELSLNLGFELAQSGHRRVLILKDGLPAWEEAGYPTRSGNAP